MNYAEIKKLASNIRLDVVKTLYGFGAGHLGGSMSIVELMAVLYGKQLKYDSKNPNWDSRDMVVLSKGHCGPAWYATLANVGFFDKEMLSTLNAGGTHLPSHPDRTKTPGVDMTTGSLGQGTSAAAGMAMAMKKNNETDRYVYCIVGDGECNEGQCWEAFQFMAHYKLNNCIVIIDNNKKQLDGTTEEIMKTFDLRKKMEAFGFYAIDCKGDDIEAIDKAIDEVKNVKDQAVCIVLDTIKGQGIKYFEELKNNHSVKFNNDEVKKAAEEAIERLSQEVKEA